MCGHRTKYIVLIAAAMLAFSSCGKNTVAEDGLSNADTTDTLTETTSETDTSENDTEALKVFFSGEIYGYTLEVREKENAECTQLVLGYGGNEYVTDLEYVQSDELVNSEFILRECDDIMNFQSFMLNFTVEYWDVTYYFGIADGTPVILGSGWGNGPDEGYIVDFDGDGMNELICNVTYFADGALDTVVYYRTGMQVMQGFVDVLLDEEYDNYGVGSESCYYLPDENKVEIGYWLDSIQNYKSKKYDVDLEKINSSDYSSVYNELPATDTSMFEDIFIQEYSTDLTKDGREESIKIYLCGMENDSPDRLEKLVENDARTVKIRVYDGNSELYEQEFAVTHIGNGQLSLVTKDGGYYLLWSSLWEGQGEGAYSYEVFDFKGGEKNIVDSYEVSFAIDESAVARANERGEKAVLREDVVPDFKSHIEKWFGGKSDGSLLLVSCDISSSYYGEFQSVYVSYGATQYKPEDYYDTVWVRKDEF
jgi:hypothetical protein